MSCYTPHDSEYWILDTHPILHKDTPFDKVRPNLDYEALSQGYQLQLPDQIRVIDYLLWLSAVDDEELSAEERSQLDDEVSNTNSFLYHKAMEDLDIKFDLAILRGMQRE